MDVNQQVGMYEHTVWSRWATETAKKCKEYGDILVEQGIPDTMMIRLVEEYHRALIADYFAPKLEIDP
jgi:hypothetical protein